LGINSLKPNFLYWRPESTILACRGGKKARRLCLHDPGKLLPQDQELYVFAQSRARVHKERAMRQRKLKWLWARLKEIAAMDIDRALERPGSQSSLRQLLDPPRKLPRSSDTTGTRFRSAAFMRFG